MSALAAQSLEYVFIPGNGGFPSVISGQDAKTRIAHNQNNEDVERDSRFSALLEQRGANVPFWFARDGVIIRGSEQTAWAIRNVVDELPNMTPSAKADNDNGANVLAFPAKEHIGAAFAEAVNPLLKAPDMGVSFKVASAYEAMTGNRLARFGYRQPEGMQHRM